MASFRRFETNYRMPKFEERKDEIGAEEVPTVSPVLYGFSFATKIWGEFNINEVEDIQFREDAIEKLVLDQDLKDMVLALVSNTQSTFSDIVEAKSGGTIFLLHGVPGVGKTLTAEAVAEYLHRPLYSVSIGELGTDVDALEDRLREILEMAQSWNAVILLDEADIFMEARDHENIQRNAMVGVFLRLLEYHQGVMFLTTNRVGQFDEAFYSRISLAIKYSGLTDSARRQVWINILTAAGLVLSDGEIDEIVSRYPSINGRQIKNAIRSAQALAKSAGEDASIKHLIKPLEMAERFMEEVKK